jgi:hypothetical protein
MFLLALKVLTVWSAVALAVGLFLGAVIRVADRATVVGRPLCGSARRTHWALRGDLAPELGARARLTRASLHSSSATL